MEMFSMGANDKSKHKFSGTKASNTAEGNQLFLKS